MATPKRPLSPFMIGPYYRPQLTSMMSIAHRGSGVVLAVGSLALVWWLLLRFERVTLDRPAKRISRLSLIWGSALMVVAVFIAILGRFDNINLENPVPLRWSDAFYSGNSQVGALGINPALFLFDTLKLEPAAFDDTARSFATGERQSIGSRPRPLLEREPLKVWRTLALLSLLCNLILLLTLLKG